MVKLLEKEKKILEKIYYNAKNPGSYGGVARLSKASNISPEKTKRWLMTQDTYTLHKPLRFKFRRRKVLAYGIGELMQCDLIDLSRLAKYNDGMKYILTIIDVFTKYAWAHPIKNKSAKSMLEAFKSLFKQTKFVVHLQSDSGKEFVNKTLSSYFKKNKINHYTSHSENKASVVERFNRTLKSKLFRIFTHTNSYRYIDVLKSVLKSYNASVHRTTGYAPIKVTPELEPIIFQKVFGYNIKSDFKFKLGDRVRISKSKRIFRRGYLPNWTDELFIIYKRYPSDPPTYLLENLKGTKVKGRFYEEELQKVLKTSHDFWRVEKILKSRGEGRKKEYFVKWRGFDKRFNSWIKSSWLR